MAGSTTTRSGDQLRPFVRGGGAWRNFKARYAETDEMYARMLAISDRLAALTVAGKADPDLLDAARDELYRGQCNCPYWHGAFGGLYLPHLRNAIYHHLIASHDLLDEAEGIEGPRVSLDVADYNLDARQEVKLENDRLIALVRPAQGGHVYELDVRHCKANVLATLDRRPEAYHAGVASGAGGPYESSKRVEGLNERLVYDRHPRKALVDHIYPLDVRLEDLIACRDVERGDFATGAYLSQGDPPRRQRRARHGAPRLGRRPRDPGPQDDPARRRVADAGGPLRARRAARGSAASISPSSSTSPAWPATPTTATIPTRKGIAWGCSTRGSTSRTRPA